MHREDEMKKESNIVLRTVDDVSVLDIIGSLDIKTAPVLKVKLESLIRLGHHKIVVNFKQTNFIDSTGVGTLMFGLKQIDPTIGDIKLVNVSPQILNILSVLELDKVFSIFTTEDSAVRNFLSDGATMH